MKKLLAILASTALVASSASAVSACTNDDATTLYSADTPQADAYRKESVNSIKSLVLADQYGMDLNKTKQDADIVSDDATPDFNKPGDSITSGLSLNGALGKDNAPLYKVQDMINGLLGKLKISPIDLTKYFDQWGGVIKEIPHFINNNDIDGLLSVLPTIVDNLAGMFKIPVSSGTIGIIADWIKMNIKYVMDLINPNNKIKDMIANAPKGTTVNMNYIAQQGMKAFGDLFNLFFNDETVPDGFKIPKNFNPNEQNPTQGDNYLSAILGQDILTPLLNNGKPDTSHLESIFNKNFLLENMGDILKDATSFIASIMYELSAYVPLFKTGDFVPQDADHIFSKTDTNEQVYGKIDNQTLTVKDDGNIYAGDNIQNVSLNDSIFGTLNILTNPDPKQFNIARLTGILFHDQYDGSGNKKANNPILDEVTYILVDAFKFTDYKVSVTKDVSVPVLGTISVGINFELSDLFGSKSEISLVTGLPTGIITGNILDKQLSVIIKEKDNGLLGISSSGIEPLLSAIIQGRKIDSGSLWTLVSAILGDYKSNSFAVAFKYQHKPGLFDGYQTTYANAKDNGWVSGTGWGMLGNGLSAIVDQLLETLYYTNGDKFFTALKGLSVAGNQLIPDDTIASLKATLQPLLPLVNQMIKLVSDVNINGVEIGDLRKYSSILNLDSAMNLLNTLFYQNSIQDTPGKTDSLLEQVLKILGNKRLTQDQKALKLNTDLGYVATKDNKWDPKSRYVYENGFAGQIINLLYPDLGDGSSQDDSPNVPGSLVDTGDKVSGRAISLRLIGLVHSDTLEAIKPLMQKVDASFEGDDISDIVNPLIDNDKVWEITNYSNKFFNGTNDLQYESYELTFDTSSITVSHTDNDGKTTVLPSKKVTYRITFSRIDSSSTFDFNKIEKIN